jgi:hypothetical protein
MLFTTFEKLVRALCNVVLKDEKFGPKDVDKDDSPGPL